MGHAHDHDRPTPARALWVAIVLNAIFLFVEGGVGWWTGSLALLSDAGHMISDVGALSVALIALRLATRKPSGQYTFGLRRAPVLGGLINGVSLIVIVVLIGIEAVSRFEDPPALPAMAVLWTGVGGLAVNLISAWYLARSRDESVNTRGAMLHLLSDALGSVAAIISAVAVGMFGARLADPIASLVIATLILVGSWPLLRDTVRILLQRAPGHIDVAAATAMLLEHPAVLAVSDVHLWDLDAGQPVLSGVITVVTDDLGAANTLTDRLRARLAAELSIDHVTLECRHASSPSIEDCC